MNSITRKFRAWDDGKKQWITDCDVYMTSNGAFYAGDFDNPPVVTIHKSNINFSTGLKDKNGIEIYEGDIVNFNDSASWKTGGHVDDHILNGVVKFSHGAYYMETSIGVYDLYSALEEDEDSEVIGHIYDGESYE